MTEKESKDTKVLDYPGLPATHTPAIPPTSHSVTLCTLWISMLPQGLWSPWNPISTLTKNSFWKKGTELVPFQCIPQPPSLRVVPQMFRLISWSWVFSQNMKSWSSWLWTVKAGRSCRRKHVLPRNPGTNVKVCRKPWMPTSVLTEAWAVVKSILQCLKVLHAWNKCVPYFIITS